MGQSNSLRYLLLNQATGMDSSPTHQAPTPLPLPAKLAYPKPQLPANLLNATSIKQVGVHRPQTARSV